MKQLVIPEKVRIGSCDYSVNFSDVVIIDGSADYSGCIDFIDTNISILNDASPQRSFQIFVHELLHGIFHEAGYVEHDEEMIVRVSNVLAQVIRDNTFHLEVKDGDKRPKKRKSASRV